MYLKYTIPQFCVGSGTDNTDRYAGFYNRSIVWFLEVMGPSLGRIQEVYQCSANTAEEEEEEDERKEVGRIGSLSSRAFAGSFAGDHVEIRRMLPTTAASRRSPRPGKEFEIRA